MQIKDDFAKSFGKGWISGYLSIFLGVASLIAVLCFMFPSWFTTPDLRVNYPVALFRVILMILLLGSFACALISFLLSRQKRLALLGIAFSGIAILLGGWNVEVGEIHPTAFPIGLDWLVLDLVMLAFIFIPLEVLFPQKVQQETLHSELTTDLIYFALSHLFVQVVGVIAQAPATILFGDLGLKKFQSHVQALPFIVQLFLALFCTDVVQYWCHRAFHEKEKLWMFHSIHHSTVTMDWLAGSRTHFVDMFATRAASFVPVYLLGIKPSVFVIYIVIISFHAVFIHANVNWKFGFLRHIISTPQFHHWHHTDDPAAYNKNYAVFFSFIDRMFGTYYLPKNVWPASYGVNMPNYPRGFLAQFSYPFKRQ